ncbi:unnamed protein product [Mytilus edulis]|uniref:Uncharacterized protein n=3 Tax=Mytilus TaxID=6548 RepID=A0A8B6GTD2_MYTGA|nr:unnamed protein product [Mytilus edulis]VDI68658.1 Hypothetical predicted protein [Mytilus galloprovincialis]
MLNLSRNLKLSIALIVTGCVIHFIGFVSPYWNIIPDTEALESTESAVRLGLWTVCIRRGKKINCVQYDHSLSQSKAAKGLETLSVIFYLLSLLSFWLYLRHPVYGGDILLVCMIFIILIVETTAVGALCWVTMSDIQKRYVLSWAFGLTVGSVIFPVIAGWFVSQERSSFIQQHRRSSLEQPEKKEILLH